jgi:hypothetical protein
MAKGFKTINVDFALYDDLMEMAKTVAKKEGLSKVSLRQLVERMKKRYEDTELNAE